MKLRITISKYHSWYFCQISLQIMLLPIQTQTQTNNQGLLPFISIFFFFFYRLCTYLRLVFTSDGVGVVSEVVGALMTWWKIGFVSGVISATESGERFRFFRLLYGLRRLCSAYVLLNTRLSESEQKRKDKLITMHFPTLCDRLVHLLLLATPST